MQSKIFKRASIVSCLERISQFRRLCRECHAQKGAEEREEEKRHRQAKLVLDRFFDKAEMFSPKTLVVHVLRQGGVDDADINLLQLDVSPNQMQFPAFLWAASIARVGCGPCSCDYGVRLKLREGGLKLMETERHMTQLKAGERQKKAHVAGLFEAFKYKSTRA